MPHTSRRDFIKHSVAAASLTILPSCATFRKRPSDKVTIALIGCGGRMKALLKELLAIDSVQVVAAVDPIKANRDEKAQTCNLHYGGNYCKAVENYNDVIQDRSIDGVVIATQDHWHVPIAIAAARAGKDMYVEKPLGLSMPRAEILRKEIRSRKLIFQYGTQQHSSVSGRQAIELVQNEYVGKITHCDVWSPVLDPKKSFSAIEEQPIPEGINYDLWLGPAPYKPYSNDRILNQKGTWHSYDYALGFIAGWGAHPLDMLQWGLDLEDTTISSCEGSGTWNDEPNNLLNTVHTWDLALQYKSGIDVRFMDTHTAEPLIKEFHPYYRANGVVYHGTEGYVVHSRGAAYVSRNGQYERINDIDFDQFKIKAVQSPGHMQNFIDSMISRRDPVSTIEAAIHSDAISHIGNAAVRSGKKIKFDPKSLVITNEPHLNSMLTRDLRSPYGDHV